MKFWGKVIFSEACVSDSGPAWQGPVRGMCVAGGCMAGRACMVGETATEAGGTHPTGMHSCV